MWSFDAIKGLKKRISELERLNRQLKTKEDKSSTKKNILLCEGGVVKMIGEMIIDQFHQSGAKNFYAVQMEDANNGDIYEVTVQKVGNESPFEQLERVKKELEELKKQLAEQK